MMQAAKWRAGRWCSCRPCDLRPRASRDCPRTNGACAIPQTGGACRIKARSTPVYRQTALCGSFCVPNQWPLTGTQTTCSRNMHFVADVAQSRVPSGPCPNGYHPDGMCLPQRAPVQCGGYGRRRGLCPVARSPWRKRVLYPKHARLPRWRRAWLLATRRIPAAGVQYARSAAPDVPAQGAF